MNKYRNPGLRNADPRRTNYNTILTQTEHTKLMIIHELTNDTFIYYFPGCERPERRGPARPALEEERDPVRWICIHYIYIYIYM